MKTNQSLQAKPAPQMCCEMWEGGQKKRPPSHYPYRATPRFVSCVPFRQNPGRLTTEILGLFTQSLWHRDSKVTCPERRPQQQATDTPAERRMFASLPGSSLPSLTFSSSSTCIEYRRRAALLAPSPLFVHSHVALAFRSRHHRG